MTSNVVKTQTLALDNRPKTWKEVVGQPVATTVLVNSLMVDDIKPGYLFTGTTGCGKTSCALLLSKRLVCENPNAETQDPCNVCKWCLKVDKGICPDVLHVDSSADRSVQFIRETVRPFLTSAPISGRKKIIIIDEAHLYKADAISAFLMILEYLPKTSPKSVVILCTTLAEAIDTAVKNRCLNIPFSPIAPGKIAEVLNKYTGAPVEALEVLAEEAGGSFRQVWSLIESWQYTGESLTEDAIMKLIGGVTSNERQALWEDLASKNMSAVLSRWRSWISSGASADVIGNHLIKDAVEFAAENPNATDWVKVFSLIAGTKQMNGSSEIAWLPPLYSMAGLPLASKNGKRPGPVRRQPQISSNEPAGQPDKIAERFMFFGA